MREGDEKMIPYRSCATIFIDCWLWPSDGAIESRGSGSVLSLLWEIKNCECKYWIKKLDGWTMRYHATRIEAYSNRPDESEKDDQFGTADERCVGSADNEDIAKSHREVQGVTKAV